MKYDCIIIGAGLSGLAAGIRLAHFNKKVCICEKHSKTGGLNSWYTRSGVEIDSGLHAMTNFATAQESKSLPLRKLLRLLRIPFDSLKLIEQNGSEIVFPEKSLRFSNDFELFRSEIASKFPEQIDRFDGLDCEIRNFDGLDVTAPYISARKILSEKLNNPLLVEMLLCPLMYYGSAVENDMDFSQFTIMYKSIFHEGFCRPAGGIKALLRLLEERFIECGGEIVNASNSEIVSDKVIALNCGIRKINIDSNRVYSVELENSTVLETDKILSSAGLLETIQLTGDDLPDNKNLPNPGNLAFVETVALLKERMSTAGHNSTILFFNDSTRFAYEKPDTLFDIRSGVVCCPDNFQFSDNDSVPHPQIRITMLADYSRWFSMDAASYRESKTELAAAALKIAAQYTSCPQMRETVKFTDVFTPATVRRFTGHFNGAVYGSPDKVKNGKTNIENLYICGTDQGFLGITGSMLSGISMANMHILK